MSASDVDVPDKAVTSEAPIAAKTASLSEREVIVLRQVGLGYETDEIAERLGVDPIRINQFLVFIVAKLDVHSSYEAYEYAVRSGLI